MVLPAKALPGELGGVLATARALLVRPDGVTQTKMPMRVEFLPARSFRPGEVSESFVTVTLPLHPQAGRRLRVLGQQRSHRGLELTAMAVIWGGVRLPATWTDRVAPEAAGRVSASGLASRPEWCLADHQAQAFDLAGDADHGGQDVDAMSGPVVALSVDLGVPASCGVREGNNGVMETRGLPSRWSGYARRLPSSLKDSGGQRRAWLCCRCMWPGPVGVHMT